MSNELIGQCVKCRKALGACTCRTVKRAFSPADERTVTEAFARIDKQKDANANCNKPHDFPKGAHSNDIVKCTKCGVEVLESKASWYRQGLKDAPLGSRTAKLRRELENITDEEWEEIRKNYEEV